jgi:hypothetical protein
MREKQASLSVLTIRQDMDMGGDITNGGDTMGIGDTMGVRIFTGEARL